VINSPIERPSDSDDAALAWLAEAPEPDEPTEAELLGLWPDPFAGRPADADEWLASLARSGAFAGNAETALTTTRIGGSGFGISYNLAAEYNLDVLAPDSVLAELTSDSVAAGLGQLTDDALVGVLRAARRVASWQDAIQLQAVIELDARRRAEAVRANSSRTHEQISAELAAGLTLTVRAADSLLGLARGLARLPMVLAALSQGLIDRAKAIVFAEELAGLNDIAAAAIAAAFWEPAASLTTGQLRAALKAMALSVDPGAARKRAERGRADARVEAWQEGSGNAGMAGRELPSAEVIAADQRITAIARALRDRGMTGSLDEVRAAVFIALLSGRDPLSLVPGKVPTPADGPELRGTVNLTMPLSAWAGWSDRPGEVAGHGPVDADTCRDLANRVTWPNPQPGTRPGTRPGKPRSRGGPAAAWCLTITDETGLAVGHACARASPKGTSGLPAWLRSLRVRWIERDSCAHQRQADGYRPSKALAHLVQIRHLTCAFPGCRRPARRCDLDHTIPYNQGGRTCECNLAALCRQHHQTKQAPGWHLDQPRPGVVRWTTPHGLSYPVEPDRYPL
jgi:hypothetical protein